MARRVLSFHYTLTNRAGDTLDSSRGSEPPAVLEGGEQLIPALEAALFELPVGATSRVELAAADAFGAVNESLKLEIPKDQFPAGVDVVVGMELQLNEDFRGPVFVVTDVGSDVVRVDGNHPMAGTDLVFDVEVLQVREATPEELTATAGCGSSCDCG